MENASKALIIAGAILLAILIISLGIMVYNQAKSTVTDANLDSEAVQTENAKFTSYIGSSVSGSKVNSLIQLGVSESKNNSNMSSFSITVSATSGVTSGTDWTTTTFDTTKSYKVEITGYSTEGFIQTITISDVSST